MGLYKATKLPAWTPVEIKHQRASVRFFHPVVIFCFEIWAQMTHYGCVKGNWSASVRKASWARPMIARIMLRERLGRKPTDREVQDQLEALKNKSDAPPPLETIAAAFENGEEVRPVSLGRRPIRIRAGTDLTRATESVSVETRVRRLRRKSTAGDRYRLPAPRKGC